MYGGLRVAGHLRSINADFTADRIAASVGAVFEFKLCDAPGQVAGGRLVCGFVSADIPVACPELCQFAFFFRIEV